MTNNTDICVFEIQIYNSIIVSSVYSAMMFRLHSQPITANDLSNIVGVGPHCHVGQHFVCRVSAALQIAHT